MEGRDIGTVVLPDAEVKFYLDASPAERARRRAADLRAAGHPVDLAQLERDIIARDRSDMSRPFSPLRRAPDAIYIDSTSLDVREVVETMLRHIARDRGRTKDK